MSKPIKLGIVGGCLGTTQHVGLSQVYYRLLMRRFQARGTGRLSIALGGYDDPGELVPQVVRLVERKHVEILVVQIRPHPLIRSAWLLWWRAEGGRRGSLALHPALWDRARTEYDAQAFSYRATHAGFRDTSGPSPEESPAPAVWRRWFKKGNVNSALGWVVGLHRWALRQHVQHLLTVRDLCVGAGVEFIVMGPGSIAIFPAADCLCGSLSHELAARMQLAGVTYVATFGGRDALGRDIRMPDAQHVNAFGHVRLADLLEPALEQAIDRARRKRSAAGPTARS